MRKGKDIVGKNVVALEGGERISSVQDLIFDHEADKLLALLVDEGGWFRTAKIVPIQAVSSFGEDAVVIGSAGDVVDATSVPRVAEILQQDKSLVGTTLMTTDGKNLGKLADLYFDEQSGRVLGYDVTGGLFADVSSGRSFVPAQGDMTIGDDVAFVPPETALAMEEQEPGGLRGAWQAGGPGQGGSGRDFVLGKTAQHEVIAPDGTLVIAAGAVVTEDEADRAQAHDAMNGLIAGVGGRLDDAGQLRGADDPLENTLGKRAYREVYGPAGVLVVAQGQVVSEDVIRRAQLSGRTQELIAATSQTAAAGQAVSDAGERLRAGASSWLDKTRSWLSDTRDKADEADEERRVQAAIGRPTNRVILDPQDNILLNLGEIITHKAVDAARRSGVLPMLLDSASTETPKIDPEHVKPDAHGSAALPEDHSGTKPS